MVSPIEVAVSAVGAIPIHRTFETAPANESGSNLDLSEWV
jgi:hypothetical protein